MVRFNLPPLSIRQISVSMHNNDENVEYVKGGNTLPHLHATADVHEQKGRKKPG